MSNDDYDNKNGEDLGGEGSLEKLSSEFTDKVLMLNGASIKVDASGNVEILGANNVFIEEMKGRVYIAPSPSQETLEIKKLRDSVEIGDLMPDGTVFAGLSYDGLGLYCLPARVEGYHSIQLAKAFLQSLTEFGYGDWRLPNHDEAKELYRNRACGNLNGLFQEDISEYRYAALYWATYGLKNKNIGTKSFHTRTFYKGHDVDRQRIFPVRSGQIPTGYLSVKK